jgi:hypothetical protein
MGDAEFFQYPGAFDHFPPAEPHSFLLQAVQKTFPDIDIAVNQEHKLLR